ncbi:MAG TPA: NUDIX hydrolase [Stellaceae bacterium]|nr:NUDIX hydrolase [Stellaceae bacterium]
MAAAGEPRWLALARELQAVAQSGLHYAKDIYDGQRYARVRELATELMALGSGAAAGEIAELFRQDVGYATPRLAVRAAAFRDDRILMVRETMDGRWSLPGGWCDVNQSAAEAVVREVWEETGFTARAVKLVALWDRSRHGHPPAAFSIHHSFFLCELTGGEPRPSVETSEIGFFAEDALPELSRGRVLPHLIARMFAHYRQPDLPTEFD